MLVVCPPVRFIFAVVMLIGIVVMRIRSSLMGYGPVVVVMVRQQIMPKQECVGEPEQGDYGEATGHLVVKVANRVFPA